MRNMPYSDLAYQVIAKYVGPEDIPSDVLKDICKRSFSKFRHVDVTPTIKKNDFYVLELFHGPTFAFKDVALQFLGNLFEYFLQKGKIQSSITILGATSGDTGSAAIHGLRGKKNVNCFILYPFGKVTEIQEKQMTTIPDANVHCASIKGDFDDAQKIVKDAFADEAFRSEVNLGAINSINWARVLAQITYYFYSWLQVTNKDVHQALKPDLNFAVPTGNFGDILAGYYAKKMGLQIDKLVVCANQNDVLDRFLKEGVYRKEESVLTIAPSMDISVSSNFERYLLYLAGEDTTKLAAWMNEFEKTGTLRVSPVEHETAKREFLSHSSSKEKIVECMRYVFDKEQYLLCPHTATAAVAVKALNLPAERTIILATAHPAKFEEACALALIEGRKTPERPAELQALYKLPVRTLELPNNLADVQKFVRSKVSRSWFDSNGPSQSFAVSNLVALAAVAFYVYSAFNK